MDLSDAFVLVSHGIFSSSIFLVWLLTVDTLNCCSVWMKTLGNQANFPKWNKESGIKVVLHKFLQDVQSLSLLPTVPAGTDCKRDRNEKIFRWNVNKHNSMLLDWNNSGPCLAVTYSKDSYFHYHREEVTQLLISPWQLKGEAVCFSGWVFLTATDSFVAETNSEDTGETHEWKCPCLPLPTFLGDDVIGGKDSFELGGNPKN